MADPAISIAVAYALADRQAVVTLTVAPGTTVAAAVAASGLVERFAEIAATPLHCAIFGRVVPLTQQVRAGDRIEVLRPLLIDPKQQRRQSAARARTKR